MFLCSIELLCGKFRQNQFLGYALSVESDQFELLSSLIGVFSFSLKKAKVVSYLLTPEEIRCVFDDNSKIIFVKSSLKLILWVFIRIASARRF